MRVRIIAVVALISTLHCVHGETSALAAHSARAALESFKSIEESLLAAKSLDVEVATSKGPLNAGPHTHNALLVLFSKALSGVRHTLLTGTLSEEERAEAGRLDDQISNLVATHSGTSLYFWHGPKRHIFSRLEALITGGEAPLLERLKQLANGPHPKTASELLGDTSPGGDGEFGSLGITYPLKPATKAEVDGLWSGASSAHKIPGAAVALGASQCPDSTCGGLADVLKEKKVSHVLIRPSGHTILERIKNVIAEPKVEFVSLDMGADVGVNDIASILISACKSLGVDGVDLIWVPKKLFLGKVLKGTTKALSGLLKSGKVKGYGVSGELTKVAAAKKLQDLQPAPLAWLSSHDVMSPIPADIHQAMAAGGITILTTPRPITDLAPVRQYVATSSSSPDSVSQQIAANRWALQLGLGLVFEHNADESLPDTIEAVQVLELPIDSMRLLCQTRIFTRPIDTVMAQGKAPAMEASDSWLMMPMILGARDSASQTTLAPRAISSKASINPKYLQDIDTYRKQFEANKFIIYMEDFFDEATFAGILAETKRLWKSEDIEANCNLDGRNRLGGYVLDHQETPGATSLYEWIYGNEPYRQFVTALNQEGEMWPSDFPIELREYGPESSGMMCHPDLQMYAMEKRDIEMVVTLDNDSKCNVQFTDAKGKKHTVHPAGNSVTMVRPNAAVHCVTPTKGGQRQILKYIYVGNYKKAKDFVHYIDNECEATNPNVRMLKERREKGKDEL